MWPFHIWKSVLPSLREVELKVVFQLFDRCPSAQACYNFLTRILDFICVFNSKWTKAWGQTLIFKPDQVQQYIFLTVQQSNSILISYIATICMRQYIIKIITGLCVWPLLPDLWTRSGCGLSHSWTSSSGWTRWRNPSRPRPSCNPVRQRFPWTDHRRHTASALCASARQIETRVRGAKGHMFSSRQGSFWACSFPAQPCYKCTVPVNYVS